MNLGDVLRETCVLVDLKGETKELVLRELVVALKQEHLVEDEEEAIRVILERENLGSTGIGDGVAIPHGKMKGLSGMLCAFGRSAKGVPFDAVDGQPVHIFFLLLAPEETAGLHLRMLSRISRILRDAPFRRKLMEQANSPELYRDIVEEDRKYSG
ncbi:MAG: IIA-like nitrogen-regulatory protein PtsN [Deltaproteobacteria bacterium]|jgi:PTS system nitrogen regulatory IIA component|nr:IIA-like nitrogen-regulatory protein PtsN [Deltaproteobacteria bacterium]